MYRVSHQLIATLQLNFVVNKPHLSKTLSQNLLDATLLLSKIKFFNTKKNRRRQKVVGTKRYLPQFLLNKNQV